MSLVLQTPFVDQTKRQQLLPTAAEAAQLGMSESDGGQMMGLLNYLFEIILSFLFSHMERCMSSGNVYNLFHSIF